MYILENCNLIFSYLRRIIYHIMSYIDPSVLSFLYLHLEDMLPFIYLRSSFASLFYFSLFFILVETLYNNFFSMSIIILEDSVHFNCPFLLRISFFTFVLS